MQIAQGKDARLPEKTSRLMQPTQGLNLDIKARVPSEQNKVNFRKTFPSKAPNKTVSMKLKNIIRDF